MIYKWEVANYLKYGITQNLSYDDPPEIDHSITFHDAVNVYKEIYEKLLFGLNHSVCSLSGGLDSTLNAYYLRDNVDYFCYPIDGHDDCRYAEKTAKEWGLKLFYLDEIDGNDIENYLLSIHSFWDKPRCITADFHLYHIFLKVKEYSDSFISGWGSNKSNLGFPTIHGPLMEKALMTGEYDISLAKSIFEYLSYDDRFFDINRAITNRHDTYSDVLSNMTATVIFTDDQIKGFGLESPLIKLREERLSHALQAISLMIDCFALGTISLLKNIDLVDYTPYGVELEEFCVSIPYEYRFCLGIDRYVQRKFMSDIGIRKDVLHRKKEAPQSSPMWWNRYHEDIVPLMNKYLDKKNFIFEILDYDYFKKEFENFTYYQKWVLLNLSIWFYRRMYV